MMSMGDRDESPRTQLFVIRQRQAIEAHNGLLSTQTTNRQVQCRLAGWVGRGCGCLGGNSWLALTRRRGIHILQGEGRKVLPEQDLIIGLMTLSFWRYVVVMQSVAKRSGRETTRSFSSPCTKRLPSLHDMTSEHQFFLIRTHLSTKYVLFLYRYL